MSVIQSCQDTNDALDFFRGQSLYLKPIARLNVSVQLPQLKKSGAKISNWEVMERVKEMAKPFNFPVFKVAKSSLEFIRFEAEIENYGSMEQVLAKLDMKTIKLSGFQELLKVRAAESKPQFPTRYDWDNFFIENKEMNELKPGERPDTIHVQNLPTKWFMNAHDKSGQAKDKPSEYVLKKVFGSFGEIRAVDIPMLDPYRDKMKSSISGIQTFTFGQDLVFDAYIQFTEYIGFVKAMNSLKGMKLLFKDRCEERSWVANIKVDFDRTKHLAESTIKQRAQEREKLIRQERDKEESERKKRQLDELKREQEKRKLEAEQKKAEAAMKAEKDEKLRRRMQREERRRLKRLEMLNDDGHDEDFVNQKIEEEERKLLLAQRKLESIRLLDELLERVKIAKARSSGKFIEANLLKFAKSRADKYKVGPGCLTYKDQDEKLIRDKLVSKLKEKEKQKVQHFGERIRNAKDTHHMSTSSSEEEYEEISEAETDDELRLTSTDDERKASESEEEEEDRERKKKKKKKRKKEKKRRHSSESEDESEEERTRRKKRHSSDSDEESEEERKRRKKRYSSDSDDESEEERKKRKKRHSSESEDDREGDKKRRKKRHDSSGRDDDGGDGDDDDAKRRRKRELENQIALAKRISSRENVKTPPPPARRPPREFRDKRRMICHETVEDRKERGLQAAQQEHEEFPAYIEKVMQERIQKKLDAKLEKKKQEMQSEELYDRMMHPHLYGGSSEGTSKYRKTRRGEHYELTQQEILDELKAKKSDEKRRADRMGVNGAYHRSRYESPPDRRYDRRYDGDRRGYDDRRDYDDRRRGGYPPPESRSRHGDYGRR